MFLPTAGCCVCIPRKLKLTIESLAGKRFAYDPDLLGGVRDQEHEHFPGGQLGHFQTVVSSELLESFSYDPVLGGVNASPLGRARAPSCYSWCGCSEVVC